MTAWNFSSNARLAAEADRSGDSVAHVANPFWTDGKGNRLPTKPCPRCGANVGPMSLRVENLRHLGWEPYTVQSYQSWCGHTQAVIPFPRPDGGPFRVGRGGRALARPALSALAAA